MLHLINKSPGSSSALESASKYAQKGSGILLFEDGVYAAMTGTAYEDDIKAIMGDHEVYALSEDLETRGISDRITDGVKVINYADFVDLVEQNKTASWS